MPATFKFIAQNSRKDVNGEAPIYLRIIVNRRKKYYNTGERIDPAYLRDNPKVGYWIKKSHPNYNTLNKEILEPLFHKAKRIASELRKNKIESAGAIKKRLQGATKENFFTIADEEIEELKKENQYHLWKQTKATKSKFQAFLDYKGYDTIDLRFTRLTTDLINNFHKWLKEEKGNKGSTIRKNMSDLRRITSRAEDQHLIFDDPFEDAKPVKQSDSKTKVKLNYKQIKKIRDLNLPPDSIEFHVRNTFLLQFYLYGMRAGDVLKLRWDRIEDGYISYVMEKTESVSYFKIPSDALDILDYYKKDDPEAVVLPFLEELTPKQLKDKDTIERKVSSCLATINEKIKEIVEQAGIDKRIATKVSSHVARHSLAYYLVKQKYSIYEISKRLRHKSVKTTEQYLKRLGLQAEDQAIETEFT